MSAHATRARWIGELGCLLLWSLPIPGAAIAQVPAAGLAAFDASAANVETRLQEKHRSPSSFLDGNLPTATLNDLKHGEAFTERLPAPPADHGALLHHWRGTTFVAGAHASDFDRLLRDFRSYPQHFAPEVQQVSASLGASGHTLLRMRVRQHHVITVVLDATYDVTFATLDARHGYSTSRSTRIDEIASPGTPREHTLSPADEHGFLWRQNTYWTFEERDGGLYLQLESLSLTRSVPHGLGWAVGPYVESIPKETLEFTLRSASNALRK